MLKDTTQLAALKDKLARDDGKRAHDKASAPADRRNTDSGVDKGSSKGTKRPGKSARSTRQVPEKPAADLEDVRRSTRAI